MLTVRFVSLPFLPSTDGIGFQVTLAMTECKFCEET